jgi:hypothetical protein
MKMIEEKVEQREKKEEKRKNNVIIIGIWEIRGNIERGWKNS